jgi:hypothetical protein
MGVRHSPETETRTHAARLGVTSWKNKRGVPQRNSGMVELAATARLFKSAHFLPGQPFSARILSTNLHGHQLRAAAGILDGFNSVLGRESSHYQCQLTVGCRLDGNLVYALHVFRGASTATVHFHNKFGVFRGFPLAWGDKPWGEQTKMTNKWEAKTGRLPFLSLTIGQRHEAVYAALP